MAEADHRIEIGFEGGLILALKVTAEEAQRLEAAVGSGSGRVELTGEDATYVVDVAKACYVKHETHIGKIGF